MKKLILIIIILMMSASFSFADDDTVEYETGIPIIDSSDQLISLSNDTMKRIFDMEDYYTSRSVFTERYLAEQDEFVDVQTPYRGTLNGSYALSGNGRTGVRMFKGWPALIYGDGLEAAKISKHYGNDQRYMDDNGKLRAIGFSFEGVPFANKEFFIDNVNYTRRWIKEPWDLPSKDDTPMKKILSPDNPSDSRKIQWMEFKENTISSTFSVISQWITHTNYVPTALERKKKDRDYFMSYIDEELPPGLRTNPEDFIYVIQPPTDYGWGVGVAYYYYGDGDKLNWYSYYHYFMFQPLLLGQNKMDIEAVYTNLPSTAKIDSDVEVVLEVSSTHDKNLDNIPYKWEITDDVTGEIITTVYSHDGVTIPAEGNITIEKDTVWESKASFKMPKNKVTVSFVINDASSGIQERDLSNNNPKSETEISPQLEVPISTPSTQNFVLDYDELKRSTAYDLVSGSISAALSYPSLTSVGWNGNATGRLNVSNGSAMLQKDFSVSNNPYVDEASALISRSPRVTMSFDRADFGDNPKEGQYAAADISTNIYTNYSGSVSRPYSYTVLETMDHGNDAKGKKIPCTGHPVWKYSSTSANFNSGTASNTITAKVYNGKSNISAPSVDVKVDNNNDYSTRKSLYYRSDIYNFNVHRLMHDVNLNNLPGSDIQVNAKYQRKFSAQESAILQYNQLSNFNDTYSASRASAKSSSQKKSDYDAAVFSTEYAHRNLDYPIKSGYYFNPGGEYELVITTNSYQRSSGSTSDHSELVNQIIKSFRLKTNLMYIDNSKNIVGIDGATLPKSYGEFVPELREVSSTSPNGVNGVKVVSVDKSDYDKTFEKLVSTVNKSGSTDERIMKVLEGYSSSNTYGSLLNYLYREYVTSENFYKVTEVTKVKITINPNNTKFYTYANMPDGRYTQTVSINNVNLSGMSYPYKTTGTIEGVNVLDTIDLEVRGSLYDDL